MGFRPSAQHCKNVDEIQYTCGDTFNDISSSKGINTQSSHSMDDSLKKLFSIVKVNNTLTCNSPIEIPYYSNGVFKEALCFNPGVECEEENNYGEYFPYCEDCSTSV
ncbi:hypothetical protein RclHR1_10170010 [Rhizophagus clarus]|uniref:Uncharacterized protein n=1 Tax=Rhizophagus clarus TaxID=94130 RepID=A0A2Z6QRT0_9GLOM|nr:hypothetical protein RclHR1_10170010 [Rhizophagus clarus]